MPKKNAMTKLSPGLRETLKTLGAGMPDDTRLKVWWIPQVPGKPFEVEVDSIEEGALLVTAFADYDMFQFENHIKPDYSNAGGLSVWDKDGKEWLDWEDDEGNDLDYYLKGGLLGGPRSLHVQAFGPASPLTPTGERQPV